MKKVKQFLSKVWGVVAPLVAERKKAIAAFLAPIVVMQLGHYVPGIHLDVALAGQLVTAVISMITVHQVTNTQPTPPPPAPEVPPVDPLTPPAS